MKTRDVIDARLFANDLLIECWRRGGMSLRAAAEEMGTSKATMSRLTRHGDAPELGTFLAACQWMQVPPESYVKRPDPQGTPTLTRQKT